MSRPALPVSLYVSNQKVLLVDGDPLADERATRLHAAGATVVRLSADELEDTHLVGALALFAHTGDEAVDRDLAKRAAAAGVLAYAHDQPDVSSFAMPAMVSADALKLAISTDATAPALARRLREELGRLVSECADLIPFVRELGARRAALPRGQRGGLYAIASRLRIDGAIRIDSGE